jgi:hypothetical protein
MRLERRLVNVTGVHQNLMVARPQIELREESRVV